MDKVTLSEEERAFMEEWCAMRGIRSKKYYRSLTDKELFDIYVELITLEESEVRENINRTEQ